MKLREAINALCVARGKISSPQFYQLMHEHDDDERIPYVRLSLLNASEVEHILCLEPAKNNQGLNYFPCGASEKKKSIETERMLRTMNWHDER